MSKPRASRRVLIRADASVSIGAGHIMRCATLADALRHSGAEVIFACRPLPGNLNDWLRQRGFTVWEWPIEDNEEAEAPAMPSNQPPFDWLIVDHYGLDARWEARMRRHAKQILVIDDLADRSHDCDWLLDQNDFAASPDRYGKRVPNHCRFLLGPQYALLRPDFSHWRQKLLGTQARQKALVNHLLVFFGGTDPTGETLKTLLAIRGMAGLQKITVVVGSGNPKQHDIQALCADMPNIRYLCQAENMAELMAEADIAIGAGGTATWERLCLGLPSIVMAVADNQREISRQVAEHGAHLYLGESQAITEVAIRDALTDLCVDHTLRKRLAEKAFAVMDGLGVQRVAEALDFESAIPLL